MYMYVYMYMYMCMYVHMYMCVCIHTKMVYTYEHVHLRLSEFSVRYGGLGNFQVVFQALSVCDAVWHESGFRRVQTLRGMLPR